MQASAAVPLLAAAPKAGSSIRLSLMLWTIKGSFDERLEAAAKAGIPSVQLVNEWVGWNDAEINRINALRKKLGVGVDAMLGQENWKNRPVSLVNPAHRDGFLADLRRSFAVAKKLDCPRIIVMSGDDRPGVPHAEQYASMVEGLKRAGDAAARENLTVIIEPLNSLVNHPGYFLTSGVEGLKAIKEVDNPHVKLLFDIYHEQVQEGNIIDTLTKNVQHIAVFHVADCPGRHDPGTGELNYANIYRAIAQTSFEGHIAMEYLPVGEQVASLAKAVGDLRRSVA